MFNYLSKTLVSLNFQNFFNNTPRPIIGLFVNVVLKMCFIKIKSSKKNHNLLSREKSHLVFSWFIKHP